jgi:hypothetical protein
VQTKRLEAWLQVLSWNREYPTGTTVTFYTAIGGLGLHLCKTRSAAAILPGHVPGVWITGHLVAVRLDQLRVYRAIAGGRVGGPPFNPPTQPQLFLCLRLKAIRKGPPKFTDAPVKKSPCAAEERDDEQLHLCTGERK